MKITDRLIGDHKTFRKMLGDLDRIADAPPSRCEMPRLIRLVELFKDHLMLHAWAEDTFYYPVIRQNLSSAPPPLSVIYMDHLDQKHRTVDGYLDRLEGEVKTGTPTPTWPQTYALFAKGLLGHMKKEEEELFPISEKLLGSDRLEAISQELEKRRKEAPTVRLHTRLAEHGTIKNTMEGRIPPMKATEELTHTHQVVGKVLEIFSPGNPRFQESIKTLRRTVEAHAWLQDEIFIPALKGKPLIEKSFLAEIAQEHKDLDQMIGLLLKTRPEEKKEAEAYVLQIRTLLEAHFKKEQDALYPIAEQVLDSAALNQLRDEMDRRKTEIRKVTLA